MSQLSSVCPHSGAVTKYMIHIRRKHCFLTFPFGSPLIYFFYFSTCWNVMSCCLSRYYCIVNNRVILAFINSSLYSCETYRQVKEMVTLHLFIEHHYKYIVLSIRERHILTLHLSTANWRIKLTTGCCCKNAASRYAISFCLVESIPQLLELWPIPMRVQGTSNFTLLYRNATMYGITCHFIWSSTCLIIVSESGELEKKHPLVLCSEGIKFKWVAPDMLHLCGHFIRLPNQSTSEFITALNSALNTKMMHTNFLHFRFLSYFIKVKTLSVKKGVQYGTAP